MTKVTGPFVFEEYLYRTDLTPLHVPRRSGKKITIKPGGVSYVRGIKGSPSFRYIVFLKEKPTERIYLNNPREVRRFTDKIGLESLDSIWRETDFLRRDNTRRIFLVWSSYKLQAKGQSKEAKCYEFL